MNKKNFKYWRITRIEKELYKLYELEGKSYLSKAQQKRISILLNQLRKLDNILTFNVRKGWQDFQRDYLPKVQKFLVEHKNIGLLEIE